MSYRMSPAERRTFLADVHIGVLSIPEPGRGPLTVPVWYDYRKESELTFVTGQHSRKGALLKEGIRVSLCVQSEATPYRYVSVEGPVVDIQTADVEHHIRPLAQRYLGREKGDHYVDHLTNIGEDVLITLRIERWLSADYSKEDGLQL